MSNKSGKASKPVCSYKDIAKNINDLLYKDFTSETKISATTVTKTGLNVALNASGATQIAELCDIKSEFKTGAIKTELKLDTKNRLTALVTYEDLFPGLKVMASTAVPVAKTPKLEIVYKMCDYAQMGATASGINAAPALESSLTVGLLDKLTLGGEVGYDTAKGAVTKYNVAASYVEKDSVITVVTADKLDTVKLGFHQVVNDTMTAGVELTKKSKGDISVTGGLAYAYDRDTTYKGKVSNAGTLGLLVATQINPNVRLTLSSELDSRQLEKGGKYGWALALKA
eukprot:jgi/Mesvir1/3277/Mv16409-RA.1